MRVSKFWSTYAYSIAKIGDKRSKFAKVCQNLANFDLASLASLANLAGVVRAYKDNCQNLTCSPLEECGLTPSEAKSGQSRILSYSGKVFVGSENACSFLTKNDE